MKNPLLCLAIFSVLASSLTAAQSQATVKAMFKYCGDQISPKLQPGDTIEPIKNGIRITTQRQHDWIQPELAACTRNYLALKNYLGLRPLAHH